MKILYYDCFCGISGDMNLGAMVDLGVDAEYLKSELNKLSIKDEFEIKFDKEIKNGITGTKAYVIMNKHDHAHRHLRHIDEIIDNSQLSEFVKAKSKDMFRVIAKAEGKVHGKSMEAVHFHEVGAIDSIVDIVGAAICFEALDVDRIYSSPVQLGGGFVNCAHGVIPVPAPATVEILKGVPVKTGLVDSETTTPTGAAILASNAETFVNLDMKISKTGYGLGTKEFEIPNVLRVYLAEM
ncbi:TIGR00299 family protein [Alkalibacter saccharofermentans DSM 14828]|uniref:TIGR00299 family protein n=1 Tax=Alkalibacter saccharofermentans DSM 14828 TaxID=1120975 RepID=A0A1M4U5S4_9FIRM|nr:TIGR00299 family protein [Alkalibacter saccharofermentans DSM 14828]